jgi:hypothetical protein
MSLATMLVPAYGKNTPKMWALWEEHGGCKTVTLDLDNGFFIMKCEEHNVPHIIAVRQS